MTGIRYLLIVYAVVSLTNIVLGNDAQTNESLRVVLDLSDGSRIIGTPGIKSVPVETCYAKMDLPLRQILAIRIEADHERASFDLQNGDKLKGVINLGPLKLLTVFGEVSIGVEHISQIGVQSGGSSSWNGLVLWNRLDSEFEVTRSRVGPGGKLNAGRFVPGRFGRGVELKMQEQYGVTFPPEIVQSPDGCIEFWAKLVDFPADLPWGDRPGLIAACDEKGTCHFMLHFNGNDGVANGGLCARVAGLGCVGTGQFGRWTYARALGSNAADWHHYALVWATDGIPGVDNGLRKGAVYVDGKLNSRVWNGGTGNRLTVPTTGRFGLLAHQGMPGGSIVFDNLKIWKYAKTNFGDREEEAPRSMIDPTGCGTEIKQIPDLQK